MKLKNILIGGSIVYGAYKLMKNVTNIQEFIIEQLTEEVARLKAVSSPVKMIIKEITGTKITARIEIYDLDGNRITYIDYTAPGNVVAVDFIEVLLHKDNKKYYVAFPVKIFTNKVAPGKGVDIKNYIEKNGFPQVYHSRDNTEIFNTQIKLLWDKIKTESYDDINDVFGQSVQPNYPAEGDEYRVDVHTLGGLELIKIF